MEEPKQKSLIDRISKLTEDTPLEELERIDISEAANLTRTLTSIALGLCLNHYRIFNLNDSRLNNKVKKLLSASSLLDAHRFILDFLRHVSRHNLPLRIPELRRLYLDRDAASDYPKAIQHILQTIDDESNEQEANEGIDTDAFRGILPLLREGLALYSQYQLVRLHTSPSSKGSCQVIPIQLGEPQGNKEPLYTLELKKSLGLNNVYVLCAGRKLISLFPIIIFSRCPTCKQEHLFIFNKRTFEHIEYKGWHPDHNLKTETGDFYAYLGKYYLKKQLYNEAKQELQRVLHRGGCDDRVKDELFNIYMKLGNRYYEQKDYKEALKEYQRAYMLNSDEISLLFHLGYCSFKIGRYPDAVDFMEKFLKHENKSVRAHVIAARSYSEIDDYACAADHFQEAHRLEPSVKQYKEEWKKYQDKAKRHRDKASDGAEVVKPITKFLVDLNLKALKGEISPIVGRESELQSLVEILNCMEKKNALVLGESGVGKTALVYELALRIVSGYFGGILADKKVYALNIPAIIAGARYRGQLEERLVELIKELKRMDDVILFIDDIHGIMASGNARNVNVDAAFILRPAIAEGDIQVIGAASFEHYRLNMENDPSITRNFQIIKLREPNMEENIAILQHYKQRFEKFHKVKVLDETLPLIIELSDIFIRERSNPDKSIAILDRACAIAKEQEAMISSQELPLVDRQKIILTVSRRTGIPEEKLTTQGSEKFLGIEERLKKRIVGQDEAIEKVARVLRVSKMKLRLKPYQPDGVFLFLGPTGVGKTELALALTEFLFGDPKKMIRLDMSEYMESISTSKLIGIAPGYVGYHDKNQLTDRVKEDPYCLVLLDEIEKASQQVLNLFLQVFDTGRLTDSKGCEVYFDNVTFVMTSNIGTSLYGQTQLGFARETSPGSIYAKPQVTKSEMLKEIKKALPPEFINRIDEIIYFNALGPAQMYGILELNLAVIVERLQNQRAIRLDVSQEAKDLLVKEGFSPEFGARNLARTLRSMFLDPLSVFLIKNEGLRQTSLCVDVSGKGLTFNLADDIN